MVQCVQSDLHFQKYGIFSNSSFNLYHTQIIATGVFIEYTFFVRFLLLYYFDITGLALGNGQGSETSSALQ